MPGANQGGENANGKLLAVPHTGGAELLGALGREAVGDDAITVLGDGGGGGAGFGLEEWHGRNRD